MFYFHLRSRRLMPAFCTLLSFGVLSVAHASSHHEFEAAQQRIKVGTQVLLDPSSGVNFSSETVPLLVRWAWVERPQGSQAELQGSQELRAHFVPDLAGHYRARANFYTSPDDEVPRFQVFVDASTDNLAPTARIQARGLPGQTEALVLDGTRSFDVNGDPLLYRWWIESAPTSSEARLSRPDSGITETSLDLPGLYRIALRVQDNQGLASKTALYEIYYDPHSSCKRRFLPEFDHRLDARTSAVIDVGQWMQSQPSHLRIDHFELWNQDVCPVDQTQNRVEFQWNGQTVSLSSAQDFLSFACQLDQDDDPGTGALVSANRRGGGLTFRLGPERGSLTFPALLSTKTMRQRFLRCAQVYPRSFGRQATPMASARFDQRSVGIGQALRIDPYRSTDIDGSWLHSRAKLLASPKKAVWSMNRLPHGDYGLNAETPGDYLVSLSVFDLYWRDNTSMLVSVGPNARSRPVARIAIPEPLERGRGYRLDGTQSYDLDHEQVQYRWSLIHQPRDGGDATLDSVKGPYAVLKTDGDGLYVVQLQVQDTSGLWSIPQTRSIVVGAALPEAVAGNDSFLDAQGGEALNATGSSGEALRFSWSNLGLGQSQSPLTIFEPEGAITEIELPKEQVSLADALRRGPVYRLRPQSRKRTRGSRRRSQACVYSTVAPTQSRRSQTRRSEEISLRSLGTFHQFIAGQDHEVWEIQNPLDLAQIIELRDEQGAVVKVVQAPARSSVVFTTSTPKDQHLVAWANEEWLAIEFPCRDWFDPQERVCRPSGSGVIQLIVSDPRGISTPDNVFVGDTDMRPWLTTYPEAVSVEGAAPVRLKGDDFGEDANGDALEYTWSLVYRPEQSRVGISGKGSSKPSVRAAELEFQPDVDGLYLIQLSAHDGQSMAEPSVIALEVKGTQPANLAPTAKVTAPLQAFVGDRVPLDGSGSSDPEGSALGYTWRWLEKPQGSAVNLSSSSGPRPNFSPDRRGQYRVELRVSDGELVSTPAAATILVPNRPPRPNVGGAVIVELGDTVELSSAPSKDPDNDALSFSWRVLALPPTSGLSLREPTMEPDFAFVPDVAGEYSVQLEADDGLEKVSVKVVVRVEAKTVPEPELPPNRPPELEALLTEYVVQAGETLQLKLRAQDPDQDPLNFFAPSLPLPAGMELDAGSGALRFTPSMEQLGEFVLGVGVSDGKEDDRDTLRVRVVSPMDLRTSVSGRVLDADDFAKGTETPLAGIPVSLQTSGLTTLTAEDGSFEFKGINAARDTVVVDPSASGGPGGYTSESRGVEIKALQSNALEPAFLLSAIGEGCADVLADADTELKSDLGVSIQIPQGSVLDQEGQPYTGEVCLGSTPRQQDHPGLPPHTTACQIFTLHAPGAVLSQGLSVEVPNQDQLSPGASAVLWTRELGGAQLRPTGSALVDESGERVTAQVSSSLAGSLTFTVLPQAPKVARAGDQVAGSYDYNVYSGNLQRKLGLPSYRALNKTQSFDWTYNSATADPSTVLAGDVRVTASASLPSSMRSWVNLGGLVLSENAEWDPRRPAQGESPQLFGQEVTLRQATPVETRGLDTGRHPYTFVATAQYACSSVSSSFAGELYVHNEQDSPMGQGWTMDGVQRLTESPEGKVLISTSEGVTTFDPEPTLSAFEEEPVVIPLIGPQGIVVDDYDSDGVSELIIPETGTGDLVFIENDAKRTYSVQRRIKVDAPADVPETGVYPPNLLGLEGADLNRDGFTDTVFANQDGRRVLRFLAGDGINGGTDPKAVRDDSAALDLALGDFDRDGLIDIVSVGRSADGGLVSRSTIRVFLNEGDGFDEETSVQRRVINKTNLQVEVGDIDGDGQLDIAARSNNEGLNFVFNDGELRFVEVSPALGRGTEIDLLDNYFDLADFNGDGLLDVVWSGSDRSNDKTPVLWVYLNQDGRSFAEPVALSLPADVADTGRVNAVDANGDGNMDIVFSTSFSQEGSENLIGGVALYLGRGDGTFEPAERSFVNHGMGTLVLADLNRDGSLDMVSTQRFSVTIDFSNPRESGRYIAGKGERSRLSKTKDGGWQRLYTDGRIVIFDAQGRQIADVDPAGNRRSFEYAGTGRLRRIRDANGKATEFEYGSEGRISAMRYPDGRVSTFEYDDAENLSSVTRPDSTRVSFRYDSAGRLVSSLNANDQRTNYKYNDLGELQSVNFPDGSSIRTRIAASVGLTNELGGLNAEPMAYVDPEDRVSEVTDERGEKTQVTVNAYGAVVQIVDALGRTITVERDSTNQPIRIERPAGDGSIRVDTLAYDARGNVVQWVQAAGSDSERTTQYEYSLDSRLLRERDPAGFETQYGYDEQGRVVSRVGPDNGEYRYTYNEKGLLLTQTDPLGHTVTYGYDANGNLSGKRAADGTNTSYQNNSSGLPEKIVHAQGISLEQVEERSYDAMDRLTALVRRAGTNTAKTQEVAYSYDPEGSLSQISVDGSLLRSMIYDERSRLVEVTDVAQGTMRRVFDKSGDLQAKIDANGRQISYTRDALGRVQSVTHADGGVNQYEYNAQNDVTRLTDAQGSVTSWTYDRFGNIASSTNPLGGVDRYAYDERDNLVSHTRPDGSVLSWSYDAFNRTTSIKSEGDTREYRYDATGNLVQASGSSGMIDLGYDTQGRLISSKVGGDGVPGPQVELTYSYDPLGRRISVQDSLGGETRYGWNGLDQLVSLDSPWGTQYTMNYNALGRRTSLASTAGMLSRRVYQGGLLVQLEQSHADRLIQHLEYQRQPNGSIAAIRDVINDQRSRAFSYDSVGRLTSVRQDGTSQPFEEYEYDKVGNRLSSHLSAQYTTSKFHQVQSDETYRYEYDLRGNRIRRTKIADGAEEAYEYDAFNRLVAYSGDGVEASYTYDALDRRVSKTVNGTTRYYVYDSGQNGAMLDHDDIWMEFASVPGEQSAVLARRWLHTDEIDEPLAFEDYGPTSTQPGSGVQRAMYADHANSVTHVVDSQAGRTLASYRYDAFGQREVLNSSLDQPYGFTGREYDEESGLYHFRARAYDPAIGQFLQVDPLGFGGGQLGLFHYVHNDPFNQRDPSGLSPSVEYKEGVPGVVAEGIAWTAPITEATAGLAGWIANTLYSIANELGEKGQLVSASVSEIKRVSCPPDALAQLEAIEPSKAGCDDEKPISSMHQIREAIYIKRLIITACFPQGDPGRESEIESLYEEMNDCRRSVFKNTTGL